MNGPSLMRSWLRNIVRSVGCGGMVIVLWAGVACPVAAQTFQGRVVDDRDEQPVPTALIRLLDENGDQRGLSIADSAGMYRLEAPGPGQYRIEAARLGFENFETPLLEVTVRDGTYPVDLLLRASPVELPGFTIETTRPLAEQVERSMRLMLGISPASMRYGPVTFVELQDHIDQNHTLEDVMRWSSFPGMVVTQTTEGPCFSLRGYGCLPVYLNGLIVKRDFILGVPLDMLYSIVVVTPTDGVMQYSAGAVLLYTEAWLR